MLPGVAEAANVTYLTMQVRHGGRDVRAMVVGIVPGEAWGAPGWPPRWWPGRRLTRGHYEAMADIASGLRLGDTPAHPPQSTTQVVGLTRRMVSSGGDPMVFIPLKDAQEAQFLKDNDAIVQSRARSAANPAFNRPGVPGLLGAVNASQTSGNAVNAVLVRLRPGADPDAVAQSVRRWKRLTVYTRAEMEGILIGKLIATSARQIGLFSVILAIVSAAIVAFIIYTLTMDKIREIAVLKLIGTRNRTIAWMILQQALALGLIGFAVGKISATFAAPAVPQVRAAAAAGLAARSPHRAGDLRAGQRHRHPHGAARRPGRSHRRLRCTPAASASRACASATAAATPPSTRSRA
jgi:putative ABC transport system permease protein